MLQSYVSATEDLYQWLLAVYQYFHSERYQYAHGWPFTVKNLPHNQIYYLHHTFYEAIWSEIVGWGCDVLNFKAG